MSAPAGRPVSASAAAVAALSRLRRSAAGHGGQTFGTRVRAETRGGSLLCVPLRGQQAPAAAARASCGSRVPLWAASHSPQSSRPVPWLTDPHGAPHAEGVLPRLQSSLATTPRPHPLLPPAPPPAFPAGVTDSFCPSSSSPDYTGLTLGGNVYTLKAADFGAYFPLPRLSPKHLDPCLGE